MVGLGLPGVPHAQDKPDWLDGRSFKYPDSQYLVGVGSGDDRRSAKQDAHAAIGKIFEAGIKQEIQEMGKYLHMDAQSDSQIRSGVERLFQIKKMIKTSAQELLKGVQIVETWVDSTQVVYRLAVLDRQRARTILQEQINQEEETIFEMYSATLEEKMGVAPDKLAVARNWYATIQAIIRRGIYDVALRIVNHGDTGVRFEVSMASVGPKLQEYLHQNFNVSVEIEGPPQVRKVLVDLLARQGLSVLSSPSASTDIAIKGKVTFTKADLPAKKRKFVRWNMEMDLLDARQGKTIGSVNRSGREAHLSGTEARVRALRTIMKKVLPPLNRQLYAYIFGISI